MDIRIEEHTGNFAENKDTARELRENKIKPALLKNEKILLDFENIDSTTQSFIHALISKIFQQKGESALELFEFKNCSVPVKSLISTVINYSLD